MDEEKAKKLDEMVRHKRNQELKLVASVVISLLLFLIYQFVPLNLSQSDMGKGTVLSWSRIQLEEGRGSYVLWVELPDGSKISAMASRYGRSPIIGENIGITKVNSLFRGTRYLWER